MIKQLAKLIESEYLNELDGGAIYSEIGTLGDADDQVGLYQFPLSCHFNIRGGRMTTDNAVSVTVTAPGVMVKIRIPIQIKELSETNELSKGDKEQPPTTLIEVDDNIQGEFIQL